MFCNTPLCYVVVSAWKFCGAVMKTSVLILLNLLNVVQKCLCCNLQAITSVIASRVVVSNYFSSCEQSAMWLLAVKSSVRLPDLHDFVSNKYGPSQLNIFLNFYPTVYIVCDFLRYLCSSSYSRLRSVIASRFFLYIPPRSPLLWRMHFLQVLVVTFFHLFSHAGASSYCYCD